MMFTGFAIFLLLAHITVGHSRRRMALLVERAQLEFTRIAEDLQRAMLQGDLRSDSRDQAVALLKRIAGSASGEFFQAINLWTMLAVAVQHRGAQARSSSYPRMPLDLQPFNDRCNMVLASFIRARHPLVAIIVVLLFAMAASPREELRLQPFHRFWDRNLLTA